MIKKTFDVNELPEVFAKAFDNIYTTNKQAADLQNKWMTVVMACDAFRKRADVATEHIRSRRDSDSIPDSVDSAFLRGAALGCMIGYRMFEMAGKMERRVVALGAETMVGEFAVGQKLRLEVEVGEDTYKEVQVTVESIDADTGQVEFDGNSVVEVLIEDGTETTELSILRLDPDTMEVELFGMDIGGLDTVSARLVD